MCLFAAVDKLHFLFVRDLFHFLNELECILFICETYYLGHSEWTRPGGGEHPESAIRNAPKRAALDIIVSPTGCRYKPEFQLKYC